MNWGNRIRRPFSSSLELSDGWQKRQSGVSSPRRSRATGRRTTRRNISTNSLKRRRKGLGAKNLLGGCGQRRGRPARCGGGGVVVAIGVVVPRSCGSRTGIRRNKSVGGTLGGRKLGREVEAREGGLLLVLGARDRRTSRRRTVLQVQTNQVVSPRGKGFGERLTTSGVGLLVTGGNEGGSTLGRGDLSRHSPPLLGALETTFPQVVQLALLLGISSAVGVGKIAVEKVERESGIGGEVQRGRARRKGGRRGKGSGGKVERRSVFHERRGTGHRSRGADQLVLLLGLLVMVVLLRHVSDLKRTSTSNRRLHILVRVGSDQLTLRAFERETKEESILDFDSFDDVPQLLDGLIPLRIVLLRDASQDSRDTTLTTGLKPSSNPGILETKFTSQLLLKFDGRVIGMVDKHPLQNTHLLRSQHLFPFVLAALLSVLDPSTNLNGRQPNLLGKSESLITFLLLGERIPNRVDFFESLTLLRGVSGTQDSLLGSCMLLWLRLLSLAKLLLGGLLGHHGGGMVLGRKMLLLGDGVMMRHHGRESWLGLLLHQHMRSRASRRRLERLRGLRLKLVQLLELLKLLKRGGLLLLLGKSHSGGGGMSRSPSRFSGGGRTRSHISRGRSSVER